MFCWVQGKRKALCFVEYAQKNMLLCIILLKVEQYLNRVEQQSSELFFSTLTLLFVYLMN